MENELQKILPNDSQLLNSKRTAKLCALFECFSRVDDTPAAVGAVISPLFNFANAVANKRRSLYVGKGDELEEIVTKDQEDEVSQLDKINTQRDILLEREIINVKTPAIIDEVSSHLDDFSDFIGNKLPNMLTGTKKVSARQQAVSGVDQTTASASKTINTIESGSDTDTGSGSDTDTGSDTDSEESKERRSSTEEERSSVDRIIKDWSEK